VAWTGDHKGGWLTISQVARCDQVSPHLIRRIIAYDQLDGRRAGSDRRIRIDRDSLQGLGRIRAWSAS
jgi:hypothetical protein